MTVSGKVERVCSLNFTVGSGRIYVGPRVPYCSCKGLSLEVSEKLLYRNGRILKSRARMFLKLHSRQQALLPMTISGPNNRNNGNSSLLYRNGRILKSRARMFLKLHSRQRALLPVTISGLFQDQTVETMKILCY